MLERVAGELGPTTYPASRSRIEVKGDRLERPGQTVLESQSIGSSSLITNPTGGHGA